MPHQIIDTRNLNPEAFASFVFDHPVASMYRLDDTRDLDSQTLGNEFWWYAKELNVIWDLEEMISNYTYLFMHPEVFHNRFSRDQLEQGFWMIIGFKDFSVSESLYHKDLSFDRQSACVKTMYPLFRDFFSIDRLGTSVWMWWDCVATPFNDDAESEFHPFNTSSTGHQLQQVIFDTLCKILMLENVACHFDAIHGLNHLHHPDTAMVLRNYMDKHPELDSDERTWIETCMRFEYM